MMYSLDFEPASSNSFMISLLTKERKILLGVTVVVFIVSATLIWQTYQTMQIFNAADAVCSTVRTGMNKAELFQHAKTNHTTISILEASGTSTQAKLGFTHTTEDSCGCMITLNDNKVTETTETFCQSQ